MGRLLILVLIVGVVLWLLAGRRRDLGAPPGAAKKPAREAEPTPMLRCAHCGVHLPLGDTVAGADGKPYCSEAHKLAGPR